MNQPIDPSNVVRIKAWECTGCGKIEAPRPCIGVCQDRSVEMVCAQAFDELMHHQQQLSADNASMREVLLRLVGTCPHDGQWEAGYRALQTRAREMLDQESRRRHQGSSGRDFGALE